MPALNNRHLCTPERVRLGCLPAERSRGRGLLGECSSIPPFFLQNFRSTTAAPRWRCFFRAACQHAASKDIHVPQPRHVVGVSAFTTVVCTMSLVPALSIPPPPSKIKPQRLAGSSYPLWVVSSPTVPMASTPTGRGRGVFRAMQPDQ